MLSNKGQIITVKRLVILLISVTLITFIFINYFSSFQSNIASENCRNWATLQSTLKLGGVKVKDLNSPCVTFSEEISGKKEEVHEQLARSLFVCWDMYGRGKIDFYSNWADWGFSNAHCRVCSDIEVGDVKTDKLDIDEFEIYLSSKKPPGNKQTYAEIFLDAEDVTVDFGEGKIDLIEGKSLYSAFVVNKVQDWDLVGTLAVVGGSCVTSGVTGGTIGFLGGPFTTTAGAAGGCLVGIVGTLTVTLIGEKDALVPSLLLIDNRDHLDNTCDLGVYYKSQEKFGVGNNE